MCSKNDVAVARSDSTAWFPMSVVLLSLIIANLDGRIAEPLKHGSNFRVHGWPAVAVKRYFTGLPQLPSRWPWPFSTVDVTDPPSPFVIVGTTRGSAYVAAVSTEISVGAAVVNVAIASLILGTTGYLLGRRVLPAMRFDLATQVAVVACIGTVFLVCRGNIGQVLDVVSAVATTVVWTACGASWYVLTRFVLRREIIGNTAPTVGNSDCQPEGE